MKYLKLILIFLLVAGGLFFAFVVVINPDSPIVEIFKREKIDCGPLMNKIEEDWGKSKEWSSALYIEHFNEINLQKRLMTSECYNSLHTRLFELSSEKLSESFASSLKADNYSHAKVTRFRNGVDTIVKYENKIKKDVEGTKRLTQIKTTYGFYEEVLKFATSNHPIKPKLLNSNTTIPYTWTSFKDRQQQVIDSANDFKTNKLFAEIKTIPVLIEGLDKVKIEEKTGGQRASFYTKLSGLIIEKYPYKVSPKNANSNSSTIVLMVDGSERIVLTDTLSRLNKKKVGQIGGLWSAFKSETNSNNSYKAPGYQELTDFKDDYTRTYSVLRDSLIQRSNKIVQY